jgi:hypothetical protein
MSRDTMGLRAALLACTLAIGLALPAPRADAASPAFNAAKGCRKQLTVQGRNYYKKRLTHVLNCVDRLLKCEVSHEIGDVGNLNVKDCRAKATDACKRRIGSAADSALSKAAAAFDARTALSCLTLDIAGMVSTASGGLWFADDATCGSSPDVATLVGCVRGEVEVLVDEVVATVKPRAALVLANAGFDNFPNIPLPPTQALVIAATAPASGVLVNPGPVNLPAGTALEVSGDATTLPCGGSSNNGRLTITVVGGAPEQEFQIKEPFGASTFALFGPYASGATIDFEVDLKDGSCMDTVAFQVTVP